MPPSTRPLRAPLLLPAVLSAIALPAWAQIAPMPVAPGQITSGPPASARPAAKLPAIRLPHLAAALARDGDVRIVAFGSSSTEGVGASSRANAYPALLETDLEDGLGMARAAVTVINRGRGGDDAEAMARRLERDVLAEAPDLVVWQTGSNDPLRGVPVERFRELTREGILAMRAGGADVVLMDQQWCRRLSASSQSSAYAAALHEVAAELGVPVIRRHDLMVAWARGGVLTPEQMIGPDGLHMTDAGYRQLAQAAAAQILAGLGVTPTHN